MENREYTDFLKSKVRLAQSTGFTIEDHEINPALKPHNRLMVKWMVEGGRRACFSSFGTHKSVTQLEVVRVILTRTGGRGLIIAPLGVRAEFVNDALNILKWKTAPKFIRRIEEAEEIGIYITNYETVRDGKLDPRLFAVASLDEASILRGLGGSKTFREFMRLFTGDAGPNGNRRGTDVVPFRFVATATPSPNEYIELLAYADFLGVMDVSQAKAQPLDANLLTRKGWIKMGDVKVGEKIISVDGDETEVLAIYPQGERDCYKITFDDGYSTECDLEHLWETQTQYQRNAHGKFLKGTSRTTSVRNNTNEDYFTVKNTEEILNSIESKHSIANVSPVEFDAKEVLIDPYLLGLLLGDGYLRPMNVLFSSADEFLLDEVRKRIPKELDLRHVSNYDYHIRNPLGRGKRNILVQNLRSYDLNGKKSESKFIPEDYLFNTIDVRISILQGLMDTDGTVCKSNGVSFTSCSKQLADDVVFLVQSLGGIARKQMKKTTHKDSYFVRITLPEHINPFLLPRKAVLVTTKYRFGLRRVIKSIELCGRKQMQCIAISHPRRLYVTDNFIVTHNTRFFKRDSTKADNLTIYPHKQEEFWMWVASWALFVSKPSDLTANPADDQGYILPPLDVRWHEIPSDHTKAGAERNGQFKLLAETAIGLEGSAKEKRLSLANRVNKMRAIANEDPEAHMILWHDLEDERRMIEKCFPDCKSVFGSQQLEVREVIVSDFSTGKLKQLAGKPSMLGSGTNLQKHCSWAIYSGIGFKFNDFIQSIHRLLRFGQTGTVRIDLIYTEAERQIRKQLERKWSQHNLMVNKMIEIIKKYGLSQAAMAQMLTRKMGVERVEVKGERFTYVNNDNVLEMPKIQENSIGLILTSIPFATQYEYSPNYADYGHSESNTEFFKQMDYSTPEAFRVLMPGRIAAIHVKDRIIPGGINGLGFQTVYPFHMEVIQHYTKHGFAYIGMKTIVTDVVRENSQTYRLGWTEQCKDGSKMGVGMPEYLLLFRKPPSDTSNAYADIPVLKQKREYDKKAGDFNGKGYSRARWQMDAHGFTRSCGDRLLNPKEVAVLESDAIFKLFKTHSLGEIWDFEQVVKIAETVEAAGKLPPGFMLLQPQSWTEEVWTDITRMLTLNGSQWSNGKEAHVCPMQFDIADRVIEQMSNPDDIVLDYFGGLGTVPLRAIKKGRRGYGIELNPVYFLDAVGYLKSEELKQNVPTLFDLVGEDIAS